MKFILFWILLWKSILADKIYLRNLIKDLHDSLPDRLISEHTLEFSMNLSIAIHSINFQNDKAVITMKTTIKWPVTDKIIITNKLLKILGKFKLDQNVIWHPKIVYNNVINHMNLQNNFHLEILNGKETWFEYQDLSIYHLPCQRITHFRLISHTECRMFAEKKLNRKLIEWDKTLNCTIHQLVDPKIKIILNTDNFLSIYLIRFSMTVPYLQFCIHSFLTIFGLFIALMSSPLCYPLQYIIFTIFHAFLWISLNEKVTYNDISMINIWIGTCGLWSGILALLMSYSAKIHQKIDKFNNCHSWTNQITQSDSKSLPYVPGPFKHRKLKSIESKIYAIHMMKLAMVIIYPVLMVAAVSFVAIDYSTYMDQKYGCI